MLIYCKIEIKKSNKFQFRKKITILKILKNFKASLIYITPDIDNKKKTSKKLSTKKLTFTKNKITNRKLGQIHGTMLQQSWVLSHDIYNHYSFHLS